MSIRVGILGYGNLGKGVESAIAQNADMELAQESRSISQQSMQQQRKPAKSASFPAAGIRVCSP